MSCGRMTRFISDVAIVLILSPCNSTSNVVTFLEICYRFTWKLSPICSQYISNISAFPIKEYLCFHGRRWETPFMKCFMIEDSHIVEYLFKVTADAKALHASTIELY